MAGVQRINFARCTSKDLASTNKLEPGTTLYRSPAAHELLRFLGTRQRSTVLDFGPLLRENVEMLTSYHCKMFVEDFHQGFSEESIAEIPPESLDLALCWDVLNYLDKSQAERLLGLIEARMKPDGRLLFLIASGNEVPKYPLRFRIVDREHMACEVDSAETIPKTPLSSRTIYALLSSWKPVHALHLRNGLQEHLFAFRG